MNNIWLYLLAKQIDCDLRQQHSHRNGYSSAELILSLGYGPTHDFPQEGSAVQRSPKSEPNKNICDVLRALQVAKTNIQSRVTSTKDQRSVTSSSVRTQNVVNFMSS